MPALLLRARRACAALIATLMVLAVSACSAASGSSSGKPQVIASFYPLQFVAERIVGDEAEVSNLTAPGVEPHDLELSPRQTASLAGAQVVFYEKGLQPAVDQAVANDAPEEVVDAASVVHLHHTDEAAEGEEHEEGEHADEGEHAEEGHDHGSTDPHFWQDPTLLAETATAFTEKMSKADPDHASTYAANNDALQADLAALDSELKAGLADCATRTIVVSHDAFEYFGERYDLDVHPIAGLSPDAEPSAKHLAELSDLIREDQITTVFNETLASPKLAETLAGDLGITTAVLDPLEGLASEKASGDYLSIMRENLAALQKASSCR